MGVRRRTPREYRKGSGVEPPENIGRVQVQRPQRISGDSGIEPQIISGGGSGVETRENIERFRRRDPREYREGSGLEPPENIGGCSGVETTENIGRFRRTLQRISGGFMLEIPREYR